MKAQYEGLLQRIAGARKRSKWGQDVTLIAVSKSQPVEAIIELYELGQRDFGENYVQELLEKAPELIAHGCGDIRWHFIGHLQTNKVKAVLPWVVALHSIDSLRLALEVSKRRKALLRPDPLQAFLEINIDLEPSKSGLRPEELEGFFAEVRRRGPELDALDIQGLMAIPAPEKARDSFARLRALAARTLENRETRGLLSMGMSGDFEQAIEEGATHIRVGTALFGPRGRGGPHLSV